MDDLAPTWLEQFQRWLDDAVVAGVADPNAMVLATADATAAPSARTVLLRALDERGLGFYTNFESRKGREALANPRASCVLHWPALERQVLASGEVERMSDAESDSYWTSRPPGSRVSAAASAQSRVVASRDELEAARSRIERSGGEVQRPAHWGGLRVVPQSVEFWQGRRDRFHDRLRFRRDGEAWVVERLAP